MIDWMSGLVRVDYTKAIISLRNITVHVSGVLTPEPSAMNQMKLPAVRGNAWIATHMHNVRQSKCQENVPEPLMLQSGHNSWLWKT